MLMLSIPEKHAIVIGAGIGGLTAATAIAAHFDRVTLIERDDLPPAAVARRGTPQAQHAHGLLAGGLIALNELFPGIEADIERAGAVRAQAGSLRLEQPGFDPFPQRDLGYSSYFLSRPLLELIVRRRTLQQENIRLYMNSRVIEISATGPDCEVSGVKFEDSDGHAQTLPAKLVVDASGRGSLTLSLLDRLGLPRPEETEIGIDMSYSTLVFDGPMRLPAAANGVLHVPLAPDNSRGAAFFPMEHDRWILSIVSGHGHLTPGDLNGFMSHVDGLRTPTIRDAVAGMTPTGEIARFLLPCSTRRYFERLEQFPSGLVAIGDAICRFNPAFGQGMSVAAQEAVVLKRLLDGGAGEKHAPQFAKDFFRALPEILETPWNVALFDFIYPKTRGARPEGLAAMLHFSAALDRLAAQDPHVHKIQSEVWDLVRPRAALLVPEIADRIAPLIQST
jgi:2-polyprenyl-6-methoxyphenol hydroxylase-like FAD-dependent oxidoreductase